jgi:uncharacterized protein YciU (UPF0263 family)
MPIILDLVEAGSYEDSTALVAGTKFNGCIKLEGVINDIVFDEVTVTWELDVTKDESFTVTVQSGAADFEETVTGLVETVRVSASKCNDAMEADSTPVSVGILFNLCFEPIGGANIASLDTISCVKDDAPNYDPMEAGSSVTTDTCGSPSGDESCRLTTLLPSAFFGSVGGEVTCSGTVTLSVTRRGLHGVNDEEGRALAETVEKEFDVTLEVEPANADAASILDFAKAVVLTGMVISAV